MKEKEKKIDTEAQQGASTQKKLLYGHVSNDTF